MSSDCAKLLFFLFLNFLNGSFQILKSSGNVKSPGLDWVRNKSYRQINKIKQNRFFYGKYFRVEFLQCFTEKGQNLVFRWTAGYLRVFFFLEGRRVGRFKLTPRFIFQEELIQYQYNFIQLLNNLFKVCWKWIRN